MNIDINQIYADILTQSEILAKQLIGDFSKQGLAALKAYLANSKSDLIDWTGQLANQRISRPEFEDLAQGDITTALLEGLAESGLAQVELDKLTAGIVNIVVSVAFNAAKTIV